MRIFVKNIYSICNRSVVNTSGMQDLFDRFKSYHPDHFMKKAKIYKPSKTAMQSGLKKFDKWIVEYITDDPGTNPLMGWESSTDTYGALKLEFSTKELAIEYAKKNKIDFEVIEPNKRKIILKSYADNFTK